MDYLVIGAGPAGLQLGYFLEQAKRDYLILEGGSQPGAFFQQYPRHRQLISINKPHTGSTDPEANMRMDWNSLLSDNPELLFTRYSPRYFPPANELLRYLKDFAERNSLRIQYNTRVTAIRRDGDFLVTDDQGREYAAKRLILATGVSKENIPEIEGIETCETYGTMSTDPLDFVDQRVLIIGKGNSAFETADNLMETAAVIHVAGPNAVRFAWRTHFVGHLRAVNNNFLDSYQLKSQNSLLDGCVKKIQKLEKGYQVTFGFMRAEEVIKDLYYDRVITCTGFRFDASVFDSSCKPELTIRNRFPAQTAEWESVNIPDLYFAGTLMQVRDFKKSTGGFIHGFRYGVRALSKMLEKKYEGIPWPSTKLAAEPMPLRDAVIERVNRTSALWQQFGFLADVIEVTPEGSARYYEEMPVDYVQQSEISKSDCYFIITLEYGPDHDKHDPFDITIGRARQDSQEMAEQGQYLHPVIRRYNAGALVAVQHLAENLENEWNRQVHYDSLQSFFGRELKGSMALTA